MAFFSTILEKIGIRTGLYPRQFWLMFAGMLISTIGSSMAWPFLMVYVSGKLDLPLTAATSLLTLSSLMSLISSLLGGPLIDRLGRKWVMVLSLVANGMGYYLMTRASSFGAFAGIMALNGTVNPLYRVGADAMLADMIPPAERPNAYSLMRMSQNLGIAIGAAAGGFVADVSYSIAFTAAGIGLGLYGLLMAAFARETIPPRTSSTPRREPFGGYGRVLSNRPFTGMVASFALVQVCTSLIWSLLLVYTKENYGMSESQYGWIPTTNALMVVLFQVLVTRITVRFPPLKALAVGAFIYALSNICVALGTHFGAFWGSMVVMTVGELILVPTSSTYAANLAPVDQRARYMSLYGLTWNFASGLGPVFGGLVSDLISPQAIWYGGALAGLAGLLGFLILDVQLKRSHPA